MSERRIALIDNAMNVIARIHKMKRPTQEIISDNIKLTAKWKFNKEHFSRFGSYIFFQPYIVHFLVKSNTM